MNFYGYEKKTTPHLDEWFKNSTIVEQTLSPSTITAQSHMSIMTGLYPNHHGVLDFNYKTFKMENPKYKLSPKDFTIAEVLQKNGYETFWFAGEPGITMFDSEFGFSRGVEHFVPRSLETEENVASITSLLNENRDKPFFAFVHTWSVHSPYWTPSGFSKKSKLPSNIDEYKKWKADLTRRQKNNEAPSYEAICKLNGWQDCSMFSPQEGLWRLTQLDPLDFATKTASFIKLILRKDSREDVADFINAYDSAISYADYLLDKLLQSLEREGKLRNTIVVLVSDHGESLLDSNEDTSHFNFSDPTIHVPWIISTPQDRKLHRGHKRLREVASLVDVMPTLLSMVQVSSARGDGVDVFSEREPDRKVYGYLQMPRVLSRYAADSKHRYIENMFSPPECMKGAERELTLESCMSLKAELDIFAH